MKKYLLFVLIIFYTTISFCQLSFPDSNAIWNVNPVTWDGKAKEEILYGLMGDTLINDTLYQKLYLLDDTTLTNEDLGIYLGGYLKIDDALWFKPAYWNYPNILLYDFSKSVGDTIWHNGSVSIGGDEMNHFFSGSDRYSVVEQINTGLEYTTIVLIIYGIIIDDQIVGIGSKYGLFGPIVNFPLSGDSWNLACFKQNDTLKYLNNIICEKCFCTGVPEDIDEQSSEDDIVVFPNPSNGSISVQIDQLYSEILIELFDDKGGLVYTRNYLEKSIDIKNLTSGVYFLKLKMDRREIIKKIVIE